MNRFGREGEDFAAESLVRDGYVILARNWHSRFGEIDIVAQKGGIIAFVEVKTRAERAMVSPAESVTRSKMTKIIRTALCYLEENPADLQPRFDVFCIETAATGGFEVRSALHIEDAFTADGLEIYR